MKKRMITKEDIYIAGYVITFASLFLRTTMFREIISSAWLYYISIAGSLLSLSSVLGKRILVKKNLVLIGIAVLGITAIATVQSDTHQPFYYLVYALPLTIKRFDHERLIRVMFYLSAGLLAVTVLASQIGIIQDLVYRQSAVGGGIRYRHALGCNYPTDCAAHLFSTMCAWVYLKRSKISFWTAASFVLFTVLALELCDARLTAGMLIILLAAAKFMEIKGNKKLKALPIVFTWCAPAAMALTWTVILTYNPRNSVMALVNSILSGRLALGQRLYNQFGITWFGQWIAQYGNGGSTESVISRFGQYTYIDMSFQRILMMYGILFAAILLFQVVRNTKHLVDKQLYMVPFLLFIITCASLVDQHYLDFIYNPFLLFVVFDGSLMEQQVKAAPVIEKVKKKSILRFGHKGKG